MNAPLINPAPVVHARRDGGRDRDERLPADTDADAPRDPFDAAEVFAHLRDISDPEHPYTLEQASVSRNRAQRAPHRLPQLNVITEDNIHVDDAGNRIECGAPV